MNIPVGERIRTAREALGLGQEVLAEKVGIPRTALSAIEHGKRQVTAEELLKFSGALARPFDYFLRPDAALVLDFQPLLRVVSAPAEAGKPRRGRPRKSDSPFAVRTALVRFEELCRMYLELEGMSGLSVPALPSYPFEPGRFMYRDAERLADLMRTKLGIGPTLPAQQLRELLEERLAIKTFILRASTALSGACIYHERVGGCVLLVPKSMPHMLFTLAHEFAHLLVHRDTPTVDEDLFATKTPKEQFANAFAAALLMPSTGVQELFWSLYRSRDQLTDLDVIHMARHFGTSFNAMLSRLQGLRLIAPGSRESLLEAYRSDRTGPEKRAAAAGLEPPKEAWWPSLPERYEFLAVRAYQQDLISIGRLAEFLPHPDGQPYTIEEAQEFVAAYRAPGNGDELPADLPGSGES